MATQSPTASMPEARIGYNTLQLASQALRGTTGSGLGGTGSSSSLQTSGSGSNTNGIGYLDYFDYDTNTNNFGLNSLNNMNMYVNTMGYSSPRIRRRNGLLGQAGGQLGGQRMKAESQNLIGLTGSGYGGALGGYGGLGGIGRTGYGGGSGYGPQVSYVSGYGPNTQCESGINPLLALLTLAGAAVGFYFIYIKLTMSGGRKFGSKTIFEDVADMMWIGKVHFYKNDLVISIFTKKLL